MSLLFRSFSTESHLWGMRHNLLQILWIGGVENVEKVFSAWAFSIWILILKIDVEGSIGLHLRPQLIHGQLIPMRHWNVVDLEFLQQLLLIGKDSLEKIFVYLLLTRHIILDYRGISRKQYATYDACQDRHKSLVWIAVYQPGLVPWTEWWCASLNQSWFSLMTFLIRNYNYLSFLLYFNFCGKSQINIETL